MFNSVWYQSLIKPMFSPPAYIFPPVWTLLYITVFLSLVLYYKEKSNTSKNGYVYFFVQLILNFIWSPTFFYFKNIGLALIIVCLLDVFLFLTIKRFYSISKISGLILIPYFLWSIFATYLTFGYFILN